MAKIFNFSKKRKQKQALKNYKKLVSMMLSYHDVVDFHADDFSKLLYSIIDIENMRAAGRVNSQNELLVNM